MVVLVLLVVVPVLELYAFVRAADAWGFFNALGLIILVSIVGVAVVRLQGLRVWRRFQEQVLAGEVPGKEIADGVALLVAGLLLITPGFVTDVVGALLLIPPLRAGLRNLLVRRAGRGRVTIIEATYDRTERHRSTGDEPPRGELGP